MKTIVTTFFTLTLLFISYRSLTYSGGPPASLTNAPGEGTCSQCHGSGTAVVSGTVWNDMNLSVVGATLGTLVENTTYSVNLTFSNPTSTKYGFELCVLPAGANSGTASLGTLISTTAATQLISSGNRSYLEHTSSGTAAPANTLTWSFSWHTPSSYAGGATFYVVVNSTDSDGNPSLEDSIYVKSFGATISLPVSWLYAKAEMGKEAVQIKWATASEKNNWKFDVEKSVDQKQWNTIGSVKGKGNSSIVNTYSFNDADIKSGTVYYRVKQIDFNGEYSYSDIVSVKNNIEQIKPIVSYDMDNHTYTVLGNELESIRVTNMNGEVKYNTSGYGMEQVIPSMAPGIYLVQINTVSHTYYQKILMQ